MSTMSILLNDYRFNLYIILHRRILGIWIAAGILFLLAILFSGWKGSTLFLAGIIWLIMTALGIFLAIFVKQRVCSKYEERETLRETQRHTNKDRETDRQTETDRDRQRL